MAPQAGSSKGKGKGEQVQSKSPAEFFAENQNIAGFDNPGKSLYTTIRELVENSLDAAESIEVLPDVTVTVEEMSEKSFNEMRGLAHKDRIDQGLFNRPAKGSKGAAAPKKQSEGGPGEGEEGGAQDGADGGNTKGKKRVDRTAVNYYRVTCEDNGCGMDHEKIPDMLGRVLSGSKYGVRQTRGKFGLGSKMALIWAKKSTGMPIEVSSAKSLDPSKPPAYVSHCVLDIDIYRNEPNIIKHTKTPNSENWRGTKIVVLVGGNWTSYRAKVLHYFQQLAIITPYANFDFSYRCAIVDPAMVLNHD